MSGLVLGVAGHVDHGKTALTRALTGVDTDRLAEEKRRGLTIEPGFAPLPLPGGITAALVDVPGHEKFIRNMLSGAAGLDAVLLTVAADDGPMPQTAEHLAICSLLGVRRGLVAITKCDRADGARLCEVGEAVRRLTAGTFLEGAPVLPVSARTGAGLDALRAALAALGADLPVRPASAPFRMSIDRVFSRDGHGTVVTGTVTDGAVAVGDEVRLYPGERRARVRALQCHGADAARLEAGCRAALNLAGVERSGVRPGDAAAAPGSLELSEVVEAELLLLPGAAGPLRTGTRLRLCHGTREVLCRCAIRGREALPPGGRTAGRLRMAEPLAFRAGDRFVVRSLSPERTVGGGVLLPLPRKAAPAPKDGEAAALLREYHEKYPLRAGMNREEFLQRLETGASVLEDLAARGLVRQKGPNLSLPGFRPGYTPELAQIRDRLEVYYRRAGLEPEENRTVDGRFGSEVPAKLVSGGVLLPLSPQYRVHRVWEARAWSSFRALFDREGPVSLGRFRDELGISRKYTLLLLEYWDRQGRARREGGARIPVLDGGPRR